MQVVCTLILCSAVILNSIEFSSQSQPPVGSTPRARSRSPALRQTYPSVLGYKYDELACIRLFPHSHPNRMYELREYVIPPGKLIGLKNNNRSLKPMPTGKQIVLSTSNGDVCAILGKTSFRLTILRPICTLIPGHCKRVKINMESGEVKELTPEEIEECPVSTQEQIANNYGVLRLSSVSSFPPPSSSVSSRTHIEPHLRDRPRSPTLSQILPSVLGFKFEDLEFIRLIPYNNHNQIFELRTYVFPSDKPIGLMTKEHILESMPTGDQIVLSYPNGDVCAILQRTSSRCAILRPIFILILGISQRVKINMRSCAVEGLTTEEAAECRITFGERITKIYKVLRL